MFFYLSKISTFIIDPVFLLLFFTVLSWIFSRKRFRQKLKSLFIILVFYALSTEIVANGLFSILEKAVPPSRLQPPYDSVIVLSGMTRSTGHPILSNIEFTDATDRILIGIKLVKENKADYLIITGGDGSLTQRNDPEAIALKKFAIEWGIDGDKIIVDAASRNTAENAINSVQIIRKKGFQKNLMVTSAFHMVRAKGCFKKAGLAVDVLPVDFRVARDALDFRAYLPSAPALKLSGEFIHETIGIFVYGLSGKASYFN